MQNKILFLFLIVSLGLVSATNFNSCQTFATTDTYDLTGNIQVNGSCLTVAVAIPTGRTVIDCHGYEIRGNYTNGTTGISYILSNDVTLQNCIFRDFGANLITTDGNNLLFQNNTFDNSSFTNVQLCTTTMCNNLTFINNTISNGFNNGVEWYGANNSIFNNNTCFLHEHGHNTDRCLHLDKNMYNVEVAYNYMWNNTLGIRSNNVNISNLSIHHNQILNVTSQGLNQQITSGIFELFNFSDNNITGAENSIGFDLTFPAASTKESDCAQYTIENNYVSGGIFIFLNALNSSSVISDLNIGGMALCNADNLTIQNVNLTGAGAGRNAAEFMHVNNLTLSNFSATNVYTALRGLIVNDSIFNLVTVNGSQIGSINFAGGTSSRNNITNTDLYNIPANTAISMGGVGNIVSDFYIHDSNTSGWVIGFQSSTTAINNTFTNGIIENTPVAIGITNLGSGNRFQNIQEQNVSTAFLVNSTASGTKTITLQNISISNSGGNPPLFKFDLYDSIAASEQYSIGLPREDFAPASLVNNRTLFRYHVLNFTKIVGSPSIDSTNFTWLDSEMYNGYNEATLESYYYNSSSGAWQLLNNTPDTTNNKLGQNPLVNAGVYGLFDYVNCPVFTVPENYEVMQDYSGAPNFLGGQFSCIYIATSNMNLECADHNISGDGTGGLGIFLATGVSNTSISNCNINTYFYGIFNQNGQNNSFSQSTISSSIASGIYLDSSNNNQITSNDFIGNAQAIDLVYADQYNSIYGNQIINSSTRGIDVSITSNLNNITLNSFSGNNIDMTFLSSTANYIAENSFSGAGFVSLQLVGATSNLFQYNLLGNAATAIDISSGAVSNSFYYNNLTSNPNGILIDSSNNNALQANRITGSTYAFRTTNSNVTIQGDAFYGNAADVEVISNSGTHSINASNVLLLPFSGILANYSNISVYDVQLNAEDYQINYGSDIPYEDATHIKFNNKRVTFNDIASNMDLDSLTYYYLPSELNMSADTLQMYSWNGSTLNNLGATQGGSALTKTNLNGVNQVGLYYAPFAITSCRTLNQSGDYQLEADVSAIASCLIFNNNSININCAGSTISGPGNNTAGAYGITSSGFNNSLIEECTFTDFDRDISVSGGNNFTVNKSTFYNSNTGILFSNQNGSIISGNYFTNMSVSGDSAIYVLSSSSNIRVSGNQIQNVLGRGIYCASVTNCTIEHNGLENIGRMGIRVASGSGAIVNNNSVSNTTDRPYLFDLNQANINITNNFANNSATDGLIFDILGTNIIANNTILNSDSQDYRITTTAMDCSGVTWINNLGSGSVPYLFNNTPGASISNQQVSGLILCGANNSVVNNVTIYNPAKHNNVLDVISASNITLTNINSSHGYSGIIAVSSTGTVQNADLRNANGAAIIGTGYGFWANGGSWNVSNAQSSNSLNNGFRASNSGVLNLVNITSENDSIGVRVSTASGLVTLINSSVRNSQDAALSNIGGTLITNNVTLYGNTLDVLVNTTASGAFNSTNLTLGFSSGLNPKVNLDWYDVIASGDIYSVKIASNPGSLPSGNSSVRNKYFNFTQIGNANISQIDFKWDELEPLNDSNLNVQKYTSVWEVPTQILNTSTNEITMTFQSGSGIYGLFDASGASYGDQDILIPLANLGAYGITAYLIYRQMQRSRGRGSRIWLFG